MVDDIWYYAGDRSTDVSGFSDLTRHRPPFFGLLIHLCFFSVSDEVVHAAGGTDGDLQHHRAGDGAGLVS